MFDRSSGMLYHLVFICILRSPVIIQFNRRRQTSFIWSARNLWPLYNAIASIASTTFQGDRHYPFLPEYFSV
ncbi:MAG: hypothetical protein GDA48_26680 [Hormoscilla sp. GM102CHS1]|nr:hypothetical protein [Hormoscilla sp. GM102CHS1]